MKSTLNKEVRDELIQRINSLTSANKAVWGKMTVSQMLKHCATAEELYLGKTHYKRLLLGRLFRKMALKSITQKEGAMMKNAKTHPAFVVQDNPELDREKQRWINFLRAYDLGHPSSIDHWFFGHMTADEIGILSYKHADHHLRQFGA